MRSVISQSYAKKDSQTRDSRLDIRRRERSEPGHGIAKLLGVPRFDLLQVYNLLSWEHHIETLKSMSLTPSAAELVGDCGR